VRSALGMLEEEGLIWRKQGSGTFSGRPAAPGAITSRTLSDNTNPLEVMDVRIEIEPALARMAAARATPSLIAQLEKIAEKAAESVDTPAWEQWDAAFHAKIASASGNRLFNAIMELIDGIRHDAPWQDFRSRVRSTGRTALSVKQHEAIIDAIRRLHPIDAENAMRAHLMSLRDAVLAELGGAHAPYIRAAASADETIKNES
jgi:DNA-binding FadR family transcriptional regulator